MSAESQKKSRRQPRQGGLSTGRILVEFLGSMNLAITLLVIVGIGSVIGTVLQQDQTYPDYFAKFGPFWFEVFRVLGLYEVYLSGWFLALMTFLILSTTVCLFRHTPVVMKEMIRFRDHYRHASLRAFSNHDEATGTVTPTEAAQAASGAFRAWGFRARIKDRGDGSWMVSGMRGASNRLGYIFTHVSIVVICIGGLIDANLNLRVQELLGNVAVETRNIPLSQISPESRLPVTGSSFSGSVNIPEGRGAGVAFLPIRDGYVVQDLPFRIEVEDFRILHYPTGEPRAYESDLIIHDPELEEPLRETIEVNYPLRYRGYNIFQASFADGGSNVRFAVHPFGARNDAPIEIEASIFDELSICRPAGPAGNGLTDQLPFTDGFRLDADGCAGHEAVEYTVELQDFALHNVHPDPESVDGGRRNVGPSYTYRIRDPQGRAMEYETYMNPIRIEGEDYFLSGMRRTEAEGFRYIHIPVDDNNSVDRFMAFRSALADPDHRRRMAADAADQALEELGVVEPALASQVAGGAEQLVDTLLDAGFDSVAMTVEQRAQASAAGDAQRGEFLEQFTHRVLERTLVRTYRDVLARERGADDIDELSMSDEDLQFYRRAIEALATMPEYGPYYFALQDFEHIQATGLQITRKPGQPVVYFGCLLLVIGIFLMFYVPHRRLWVLVEPAENGGNRFLMAGHSGRQTDAFSEEFASVRDAVRQVTGAGRVDKPTE